MKAAELRDAILASDDRPIAPVDCPEWGTTVHVRTMSAGERDEWGRLWDAADKPQDETAALAKTIPKDMASHLVLLTACDENGVRVFEPEDLDALTEKNGTVIERIARQSMAHNGLLGSSIGDAEKN